MEKRNKTKKTWKFCPILHLFFLWRVSTKERFNYSEFSFVLLQIFNTKIFLFFPSPEGLTQVESFFPTPSAIFFHFCTHKTEQKNKNFTFYRWMIVWGFAVWDKTSGEIFFKNTKTKSNSCFPNFIRLCVNAVCLAFNFFFFLIFILGTHFSFFWVSIQFTFLFFLLLLD